jgi:hypothetical protein
MFIPSALKDKIEKIAKSHASGISLDVLADQYKVLLSKFSLQKGYQNMHRN